MRLYNAGWTVDAGEMVWGFMMGNRLLGAMLVALLSANAAVVAETPGTVEAAPIESIPATVAPAESFQVRIRTISTDSRRHLPMTPRYAEMQTSVDSVSIECDFQSQIDLGPCRAVLNVEDAAGANVHRGEVEFDFPKGGSTCRFTWDATALPDGPYGLDIVLYDSIQRDMAWANLTLTKLSSTATQQRLDAARSAIERLAAFIDGPVNRDLGPVERLRERLAIARDFLARAETADRANWQYVNRAATHALKTADSIRARLTFDARDKQDGVEAPAPGTRLAIRDGGLYAAGHPVFLAGLRGAPDDPNVLDMAKRYGLDLIVLDADYGANGPSLDTLRTRWDSPLEAARSANLNTMIVMNSPSQVALPNENEQETPFRIAQESIRAYAGYFGGKPIVFGLAIAANPRFSMAGAHVERAFQEHVMAVYDDRFVLNRAWLTRFMSFDEIRIAPDYDQGAYQADWQRFQRDRLTRELMDLRDEAATAAPGLALQVLHGSGTFSQGESRDGVDHQALARAFPLGGTDAVASPVHPVYALNYPMPSIVYALKRSFAPEVPLINVEPIAPHQPFLAPPDSAAYMRTLLWDGAIEGVDGFVFPAPSPGKENTLDDPPAMDGFAVAHAELNRQAAILRAFQEAPPEIGILWSEASKVMNDGKPYLASVMRAYEGTSFMGMKVGFVTEDRCTAETLAKLKMLIIASMPALDSKAFAEFDAYVTAGGLVIRAGTPIPYDENGQSRDTVAAVSRDTLLVRGSDEPKEYLSMVDAAIARKDIATPPRLVTAYGYPFEGVKSRYVEHDGAGYLYMVNFRREGVTVKLTEGYGSGIDMVANRPVEFPLYIAPLDPMLIRLDAPAPADSYESLDEKAPAEETVVGPDGIPTGQVKPIEGA